LTPDICRLRETRLPEVEIETLETEDGDDDLTVLAGVEAIDELELLLLL
jgi:hypothetical protein